MPGKGIDKNRRSAFSTPRQATKKGLTSTRLPFIYKKMLQNYDPKTKCVGALIYLSQKVGTPLEGWMGMTANHISPVC